MGMQELFGALETAAYETVHNYRDPASKARGAVGLAPRINMQPGTLSNKVNLSMDNQLGLRESIPLQLVANDFQILYAYNQALDHVAYRLPDANGLSDIALLEQYANLHGDLGTVAHEVREAIRDNRITSEELARMRKAFDAAMRSGLGFLARMEALVDD